MLGTLEKKNQVIQESLGPLLGKLEVRPKKKASLDFGWEIRKIGPD